MRFLSLPPDVADELRARSAGAQRAFGSLRVQATLGETTWQTSLFPDRTSDSYLLPVKADVRRAEGVSEGEFATVRLELEL